MANVLETLVVKLALDGADYAGGIQKAQGGLDSFSDKAKGIGTVLSVGITAPLTALGGAAVDAASDLNESMSKVSVVFGDNADEIMAWSSTSATALGQSQQQALEAAGTFGNLFTAMGIGGDASVDMSKQVVQLASDLASFNNIGADEALEKLRAGLLGEAEPLRTLGVNLSAAAIEAQAVTMGLANQGDELTAAQKAQASFALILQQTTTAQGDFARTADGLANGQRIVQAELADTTSTMGQELLPVALEIAKALRGVLGWFKSLSPETKHWIVIIAGAAAAIGPILVVLGTLAGAISSIIAVATAAGPVIAGIGAALTLLTGPIGLIVAAVALLAAAWATDFGGIRTKTEEFWNWLTGMWPGWMGGLQSGWEGFTNWWQSDTQSKLASVQSGWESFYGWLDSSSGGSLSTVQSSWQGFSDQVVAINQGLWDQIQWATQTGVDASKGLVTAGAQFMQGDWEGGLNTLRDTATGVWDSIYSQFQTQIDAITGIFSGIDWASLGSGIVEGIADGLRNSIGWVEDAARDAAQRALDAAKSWLGIGSPSKVAAAELGAPFTEGVGIGAEKEIPAATRRIQAALNQMTDGLTLSSPQGTAGTGGARGPITINIYANDRNTALAAQSGLLDALRQVGLA